MSLLREIFLVLSMKLRNMMNILLSMVFISINHLLKSLLMRMIIMFVISLYPVVKFSRFTFIIQPVQVVGVSGYFERLLIVVVNSIQKKMTFDEKVLMSMRSSLTLKELMSKFTQ